MVSNLDYHPGLRDSDHCYLTVQFNCYALLEHKIGFNYSKVAMLVQTLCINQCIPKVKYCSTN